jgi:hypothetical protein
MNPKDKNERLENDRFTEDEIARGHLGGPRGSKELPPAPMTPQNRKDTSPEDDPGHTA